MFNIRHKLKAAKILIIIAMLFPVIIFAEPIKAVVGIPPLKYLVQRIGGDRVNVTTVVGGGNPETYEPQPQQITNFAQAKIYYFVHLPFEIMLLARIKHSNPNLDVVDLWSGINLRSLDGGVDPHVWTSPKNAEQISLTIYNSLVAADPQGKDFYTKNYHALKKDLNQLDRKLRKDFLNLKQKTFLVLHPTWGYFADSYGLKQIAVETEGKETGPQDLSRVLKEAQARGMKVIFIQPQFSKAQGEAIADILKGSTVTIDPLAEDYLANTEKTAKAIADSLN